MSTLWTGVYRTLQNVHLFLYEERNGRMFTESVSASNILAIHFNQFTSNTTMFIGGGTGVYVSTHTHTHKHAPPPPPPPCTHIHSHAHTHTYTCTHARTHTHTLLYMCTYNPSFNIGYTILYFWSLCWLSW